jgi:hypothetical protein
MASRLKAAAAAKLARQAAGDFGPIPSKPSQYAAIQPDAAAYNVFGPQYAASLAADTGVPAANILNQRALRVDSEEENQRYMDAIAAANENQRYLQNAAAIAEQKGRIGDHDLDPTINKTIGTATVDDQGYIQVEPHAAGVQTAENLNSTTMQSAGMMQLWLLLLLLSIMQSILAILVSKLLYSTVLMVTRLRHYCH